MPIEKGRTWGAPGPLPDDGVVVRSDAEMRAVVEAARRAGEPVPPFGLLGGDLCRTLGGRGDEGRLRGEQAMTFAVDLGSVLLDGRLHWFCAWLVARNRTWTRAFAAMNAQWVGRWNLGPRAHPNDGLLDTYDARLRLGGLPEVARRARLGAHLPHPHIRPERAAAVQRGFERPLGVWLDGVRVGTARHVSVRVEPDALTVVV